MPRTLIIMTLFLLVTAPLSSAGSASDNDAPDPEGDSPLGPWSDMLGGWFTRSDGELVVHWQVPSLAGADTNSCWNGDFRMNGELWVLFARYDGNGNINVVQRSPSVQDAYVEATITPGTPTTISVPYDGGIFPVPAGSELRFEHLWSCETHGGNPVDTVEDGRTVTLAGAPWTPSAADNTYTGTALLPWAQYLLHEGCADDEDPECVQLAPEDAGNVFHFERHDVGGLVSPTVSNVTLIPGMWYCFYESDGAMKACNTGRVPRTAAYLSVHSLDGVLVDWTATVG